MRILNELSVTDDGLNCGTGRRYTDQVYVPAAVQTFELLNRLKIGAVADNAHRRLRAHDGDVSDIIVDAVQLRGLIDLDIFGQRAETSRLVRPALAQQGVGIAGLFDDIGVVRPAIGDHQRPVGEFEVERPVGGGLQRSARHQLDVEYHGIDIHARLISDRDGVAGDDSLFVPDLRRKDRVGDILGLGRHQVGFFVEVAHVHDDAVRRREVDLGGRRARRFEDRTPGHVERNLHFGKVGHVLELPEGNGLVGIRNNSGDRRVAVGSRHGNERLGNFRGPFFIVVRTRCNKKRTHAAQQRSQQGGGKKFFHNQVF